MSLQINQSIVGDFFWDEFKNKGDIIISSGNINNQAIAFPIGADDNVLVADSTQPYGVKWSTISGSVAGTIPSFQCKRTTTIPVSTVFTNITFTYPVEITNSTAITLDNITNYKIFLNESGLYYINFHTQAEDAFIRLYKNDIEVISGSNVASNNTNSSYNLLGSTVICSFTSGDYFTLQCLNSKAINFPTFLNVFKMNSPTGIVWRGAWSSSTSYDVNDAVYYLGNSYIAINSSLNNTPPNISYWDLIASSGGTLTPDFFELAIINVKKTTTQAISASFANVSFTTPADIENNSSVLSLDSVDTYKININETGYYQFSYSITGNDLTARLYLNNTSAILNSQRSINNANNLYNTLNHSTLAYLNSGDFVALQIINPQAITFPIYLNAYKMDSVIGIRWRGTYNNGTQYYYNDAVQYNGSSYLCIVDTLGNLPTNITYWTVLALGSANSVITNENGNTTTPFISSSSSATSITNTTTTPLAGNYYVSFSAAISVSNSTSTCILGIYQNGTLITLSKRTILNLVNSNEVISVHSQTLCSVNGSDVIDARISITGGGTITIYERNLITLKTA